ncbi:mechanosensitive ion channel domain-containing protein [Microscilla marina]|uniref:Mechanosensitive ion channel MscS domain-containing protein n=1 Tax=Microscilla marina ATCC 23134 TaxID=313606 RepID=A1ZG45_MICM2|nr:mechanosensitive ion channel domain-containing protein [Microscilla marina]EAY30462.1 hypothetical protein M23134_03098 [Microscilla marina ATCC 23134]
MKRLFSNYQVIIIKRVFIHQLFCIALLFVYNSTWAQTTGNLHNLSNEALLRQADKMFSTSQFSYRKELRKFYSDEKIIQESDRQLSNFRLPDSTFRKPAKELTPLEISVLKAKHIARLLNAYKQKALLLERKQTALETLLTQVDEVLFSSNRFKNDLILLTPYLLEVKLRINDGTLIASKLPASLSQENIKAKQQKLSGIEKRFEGINKVVKKEIISLGSDIAENKKAIAQVALQLFTAKEKQANEQKNVALQNKYAAMTPKKLLRTFAELSEEKNWIKSSYLVAYNKVMALGKEAEVRYKKIELKKPPKTKRIEESKDTKKTIQALNSLLKYDSVQIKNTNELQSQLKALIASKEVFTAEAAVIGEHLSKMIFIAKLIKNLEEKGEVKPESMLSANWYKAIIAEEESLTKQNAEVIILSENAKKQIELNAKEIKKLMANYDEIASKKNSLERTAKSLMKVEKWKAKLENIGKKKLLNTFTTLTDSLAMRQRRLESYYKRYKGAEDTAKTIKRELNILKGPLFRIIKRESQEDKYGIRSQLYALIHKRAQRKQVQIFTKKEQKVDSLLVKPEAEKAKSKSLFKNIAGEKYQNLLAQNVETIQKRKSLKDSLKTSLDSLQMYLRQLLVKREKITDILLQQNLYAGQIKKLYSQAKIKRKEVPAKVNEALKYERISNFESLTHELFGVELSIQRELKRLSQTEEKNELQAQFIKMQKNTGERGSIHKQLEELQQEFDNKKVALKGTALEVSEQLAVNRLNSDNGIEEFFLGFINSSETQNYSKILTSNYVELIQLEQQQRILQTQIYKLEKLTKLEYAEKDSIPVLLTFLNKHLEQLELAYEEEWIKIKIRLVPEKANELINAFQVKTGRNIPLLAPVAQSSQDSIISISTDLLFDYHVQIAATKKWITLFKERQTPGGIEKEIDIYADIISALEAKNVVLKKSIAELIGHPKSELDKMDKEERPQTSLARLIFLKGKIGALRSTRNRLRYKVLLYMIIKLSFIVLIAWFLIKIVKSMVARVISTTTKAKEGKYTEALLTQKKSRTIVLLSRFFKKRKREGEEKVDELEWLKKADFLPMVYFLKALTIVVIWLFAITLSIETLGFNAGAILAGLGIGGFALAFALKDILADLLGGLTLLITKPFKVGERVVVAGIDGWVHKIGLRSSVINNFYGEKNVISNRVFINSTIKNKDS